MKLRLMIHFQIRRSKLKVIKVIKDPNAFGGGLLFYVREKLNCGSLEIFPFNTFNEILLLELRKLVIQND